MQKIREFLWTAEHDSMPFSQLSKRNADSDEQTAADINTYENIIPYKEDSGSFLPNIIGYLHEDGLSHPAMLVVPGGGYYVVSPSESRLVADQFYAAGYHTFILVYTTNCGDMRDFLNLPLHALGTQPLKDISRAVCCIRLHAAAWHVDPAHIAVCGFSAGAHLTGSLAVHYGRDFLQKDISCYLSESSVPNPAAATDISALNRPNAVILSYPVITTDSRFWHEGSIKALTGPSPTPEELAFYSLEKQVTADTPPVFLWHTITDDAVPVENSLLFMNACRKADVPCELHLFPEGAHGLSTADENWQNGNYGEDSELCMEQFSTMLKAAALHDPSRIPALAAPLLAHPELSYFASHFHDIYTEYRGYSYSSDRKKDDAVSRWPSLAVSFLKRFGF